MHRKTTAARRHGLRACQGIVLAAGLLLSSCAQNEAANSASAQAPATIGANTLNVADAAIAGGDPSMALSVSQSILASDANNVDALVHEGDAYYALGRCPAAQAAYQLALDHDAHAASAELGLGRCLLKTDPAAAESALTAAVQDDPGNGAAWNDLGIARDLEGNFAGAVEPYQRALLADPTLTPAEVNLGLSLALSGNGPEALQYLGPLATGPDATPKIREDYAAALVASGRPDQARLVLAVDLPPDQVNSAMDGFSALIASDQQPPPPPEPPPPTQPAVVAPPITQTSTMAEAPPAPQPAPPPEAEAAPAPAPETAAAAPPASVPDNSDAAYTGPPPVPVTASSSTPGPMGAPLAEPADATPPMPQAAPPGPAAMPAASSGGDEVQLGALDSPDDAERAWRDISNATPALFSGKEPDIQPATVNGKTYYRLRIGGFNSKADAATFCAEVSAAGDACTVANF